VPRPPEPGCYGIRTREGVGAIMQYDDSGRLVEFLGPVALSRPPKRLSVRYLGRSWGEIRRGRELRREVELAELRARIAAEGGTYNI
jgi:hypothetical protein